MRRGHLSKVQTATSYVSGDLNDFVSPLVSLYDSLPYHAACPSDSIVHVNPVPASTSHASFGKGVQDTGRHLTSRAGGRCGPRTYSSQMVVIYHPYI